MKISKTTNRRHGINRNLRIGNQRGFFTVAVGLGLSAVFALMGTALEPEQKSSTVNDQAVMQQDTNITQSKFVHYEGYPGQHQF